MVRTSFKTSGSNFSLSLIFGINTAVATVVFSNVMHPPKYRVSPATRAWRAGTPAWAPCSLFVTDHTQ
jgi:hypothetical protein